MKEYWCEFDEFDALEGSTVGSYSLELIIPEPTKSMHSYIHFEKTLDSKTFEILEKRILKLTQSNRKENFVHGIEIEFSY